MNHLYTIIQPIHCARSLLPPASRARRCARARLGGHIHGTRYSQPNQRIISQSDCRTRPCRRKRWIKIISEVAATGPLGGRRIGWVRHAKDQRIQKLGLIGSSPSFVGCWPVSRRQHQRIFIKRRMADDAVMHDSTAHHCAVEIGRLLCRGCFAGFPWGLERTQYEAAEGMRPVGPATLIWHWCFPQGPSTGPEQRDSCCTKSPCLGLVGS